MVIGRSTCAGLVTTDGQKLAAPFNPYIADVSYRS